MSLALGLQLESLLGRHSGPRVYPGVPVSNKTLALLQSLNLDSVQITRFTRLTPGRALNYGLEPIGMVSWMLFSGDRNLGANIKKLKAKGFSRASLLVGGNFASIDVVRNRIETLLEIQEKFGFTLYLETHRGTVTESMERTLSLAREYPELCFNLDLSHWYVSHRLDLMSADLVCRHLQPVLERAGIIHARVARKDDIQGSIDDNKSGDFFLHVWRHVIKSVSARQATVNFIPEILPGISGYHYRNSPVDRWREVNKLFSAIREVP